MACWYRVQRVSVNDVFACEVRCDEGAYVWSLIDESFVSPHYTAHGHGPIPSQHLPLGTSMDGVPWTERVPHWIDREPEMRQQWPGGG